MVYVRSRDLIRYARLIYYYTFFCPSCFYCSTQHDINYIQISGFDIDRHIYIIRNIYILQKRSSHVCVRAFSASGPMPCHALIMWFPD